MISSKKMMAAPGERGGRLYCIVLLDVISRRVATMGETPFEINTNEREPTPEGAHADQAAPAATPDTAAAINFLKLFAPDGWWALTGIVPDTRKIETRTFNVSEEREAAAWLDARQGHRNMYFSVNQPESRLTTKATKQQIAEVGALHVDVDPDPDRPLAEEQARILGMLKNYSPRPSIIVFSGGGGQAFWLLKKPVPAGANLERIESCNRVLERALGDDKCHNIDRIMRLPGTINLPDNKKLAKGRVTACAYVVEADWELRYTLDDFDVEPPSGDETTAESQNDADADDGDIDIDALPISERMKDLIRGKDDPAHTPPYKSRSERFWAVLLAICAAGCSDAQMRVIFLDARFPISAHVLAQPKPDEYLKRQIAKTREKVAVKPEVPSFLPFVDFTVDDGKVPPFPLHVLPEPFRSYIALEAEIMQCQPDFIGVPLFSVAASMLGRDFAIQPTSHDTSWKEPSIIWTAQIAPSGTMKSPASKKATKFVTHFQDRLYREWKNAVEQWEIERQQDPKAAGKRPLLETIYVSDTTAESLKMNISETHNADPRGILYDPDELAGWFNSHDQYKGGRGNDRQFYLKLYDGEVIRVDRKKDGDSEFIARHAVSLTGTIQPEKAQEVFSKGEDGLTPRFQFMVWPAPFGEVMTVKRATDKKLYDAVFERLMEMRGAHLPRDPAKTPYDDYIGEPLRLKQGETQATFDEWLRKNRNRKEEGMFASYVEKQRGAFARLAMILHMMKGGEAAANKPIDMETFHATRELIGFFEQHARRIYRVLGAHPAHAGALKIAEWIRRERVMQFTARDVRRPKWAEFAKERDLVAILAALNYLEAHGWVRIEQRPPSGPKGGRPPEIVAHVNPAVWAAGG